MKAFLYKIQCITNLHVGSGDANYSVVDNEVEKDPVLGCPIIHSSGVKGALRDFYTETKYKEEYEKNKKIMDDEQAQKTAKETAAKAARKVFGEPATKEKPNAPASDTLKFMDACLLFRPLRVKDGPSSFMQTTTVDIVNHFIRQTKAFGCIPKGLEVLEEMSALPFKIKEFLTSLNSDKLKVEDEETGCLANRINCLDVLKTLLGNDFAIAKSLDDYPLPVVARNKLEEKISKTLWYEEYVPHDSVFFLIVLAQDEKDLDWLPDGSLVQFGGNASVGCGYTKLTRWGGFKENE